MTNSKTLFSTLVSQIHLNESKEEIESIVFRILEDKYHLTRTDILLGKEVVVNEDELTSIIDRVNKHEPIQYILNEEYFFGRKFYVDRSVLIPRPETEELVREVIALMKAKQRIKIIDVGTGSGCIAITLALELPGVEVFAVDISDDALNVAKNNAQRLNANVRFIKHDILNQELFLNEIDVIVSNPPYISPEEKKMMQKNVLDFEPHQALFAPGTDPLIFYKKMAEQAQKNLKAGGCLAVEINEHYSNEIVRIFEKEGLHKVQVKKDINNKPRVITAFKN